ncbi:MAG: hypothetical protein QM662_17200 [Gordonia sp. (in: high G+C Gram-positive bacteria)]
MTSKRFVEAVAAHLNTRLHQARGGYRCRCGSCRHQIHAAAARAGISPQQLLAALPPQTPTPQTPTPRSGARTRRALSTPIAWSMTVSAGREQLQGLAAIESLIDGEIG